MGAQSSMYSGTVAPPAYGAGDTVKAKGRYGTQTVVGIVPNAVDPTGGNDGHGYVVQGGKSGRQSVHASSDLEAFELGTEELQ